MTIREVSERYNISQDTLRYYERIGMIPPVTRSPGGIRDYREKDLSWVELAICMRSAGLPVEVMIEYVRLYQQGDVTMQARMELLQEQREKLLEQRQQLDTTLKRLDYKISVYEEGIRTGVLNWDSEEKCGE